MPDACTEPPDNVEMPAATRGSLACRLQSQPNRGSPSIWSRHQPVYPDPMPLRLQPRGQFGLESEHHALAVCVDRPLQCAAAMDAVEDQVAPGVPQGGVDPVRHLLGTQQLSGTRQQDAGRAVRRGVEEVGVLAPRNAAAVLGRPDVEELGLQSGQGGSMVDVVHALGPLEGDAEPRHVVVVVVGPALHVPNPVAARDPHDSAAAPRGRVTVGGIDRQVDQVCLPPVVPAQEQPLPPHRGPRHDTEDGSRQCPQASQMPRNHRTLSGIRTGRPLILHELIFLISLPPRYQAFVRSAC